MANENVVLFPKLKLNSPPQSLEEVLGAVRENRIAYVDDVADELSQYVITECQNSGFDLDSDDLALVSSVHLMIESIRGILFHLSNMEHPLHEVANQMYLEEVEENALEAALMVDSDEFME